MHRSMLRHHVPTVMMVMLLSGCSAYRYLHTASADGMPSTEIDVQNTPNPIPKKEPLSAFGNARTYHVLGKTYHVLPTAKGYHKRGLASWYGTKFHGRLTSTREPYNMFAMTAASTELPIPCYVHVTNLDNGRSAIVRVNDRGPFHGHRIMDLSYAAAQKLGVLKSGTAHVDIRAIEDNTTPTPSHHVAQISTMPTLQLSAFHDRQHAKANMAWLQQYPHLQRLNMVTQDNLFKVRTTPVSAQAYENTLKTLKKLHIHPMIIR